MGWRRLVARRSRDPEYAESDLAVWLWVLVNILQAIFLAFVAWAFLHGRFRLLSIFVAAMVVAILVAAAVSRRPGRTETDSFGRWMLAAPLGGFLIGLVVFAFVTSRPGLGVALVAGLVVAGLVVRFATRERVAAEREPKTVE